jgi:hypothetical protein
VSDSQGEPEMDRYQNNLKKKVARQVARQVKVARQETQRWEGHSLKHKNLSQSKVKIQQQIN